MRFQKGCPQCAEEKEKGLYQDGFTPHRWAAALHAFADGRPIQCRLSDPRGKFHPNPDVGWMDFRPSLAAWGSPNFLSLEHEWRPKPEKKPDMIQFAVVHPHKTITYSIRNTLPDAMETWRSLMASRIEFFGLSYTTMHPFSIERRVFDGDTGKLKFVEVVKT